MDAKNYICIQFNSSRWAGGCEHVIVQCDTEDQALYAAFEYMDNYMRELYSDEDAEEYGEDVDDCAYVVEDYINLGMLDDAGVQRAAEYYGCEVL